MAFTIPTLPEVSGWLRGLVPSAVRAARADIWPNNWTILVKVIAMAVAQGNLRARWIFRQVFVSTAEADFLDLHGYEIGVARKAASAATGSATFPALNGASVPAGAVVDAGGVAFTVRAAAVGADGVVTLALDAIEAGPRGNIAAGGEVRLREPFAGVTQDGEIAPGGVAGGAEAEGDGPYRKRLLFRKRNKPRGGAEADYVAWATEVAGVADCAVHPLTPSLGTVTIWPLLEGSGAARLPLTADVIRVADHIETRRPLTATVIVGAAGAKIINVTLTQLSPDSVDARREIGFELADMFDERAFVARDGESFPVSWIGEAVSRAIGESRHRLTSPSADIALAAGEYPVLGTVTVT
jgi:uncharacterized phage protein gp47/JayE